MWVCIDLLLLDKLGVGVAVLQSLGGWDGLDIGRFRVYSGLMCASSF